MRTTLAGLAIATLAAFGTIALVAAPASAQPTNRSQPDDTTQPDDTARHERTPRDRSPEERRAQREARLDQLVEDGKLSPERATEIKDRLAERAERQVERQANRQATREDLATTLGITADELTTALRAGSSLADLAAAASVEPNVIIDQLVATATSHIQAAVADGHLDQARADELLATLEERITARVNGERPERTDGSRRGNHGPGQFRDRIDGRFGTQTPGN